MQNICKSVHLDFNDTSLSNDELEGDLKDIFGFDESGFEFPDYKNDSVLSKKSIKFEESSKVDIHIGKIFFKRRTLVKIRNDPNSVES